MAPPSAYMLFCNENREAARQKLASEGHEKMPVTMVAKELGQMWKALNDEDRAKFRARAEELLKQWKQEHPEQPGEQDAEGGAAAPAGAQLPTTLPASWVRRVVSLDHEVNRCTGEALMALSAAADVFLTAVCAKATAAAAGAKRRTVRLDDVDRCVRGDKRLVAVGLTAVLSMVSASASAAEDLKAAAPPGKKPKLDKPEVAANNIKRAFGLA
ncbi:hypothetical protein GPECTOR_70g512 [Gonium pectorale]|uniref:HMG box domain-containing protein n=1 Tax=Gonium pectorale TaxID=33097 RepID=A0A150G3B1_GONPE|nr:hypothetical protein GPECTOR_70g512 [Gonium pectorale]|eukprot:KXZ44281.1 hypothetical protein GPECTOR_70g512 [Gonium pectorale]